MNQISRETLHEDTFVQPTSLVELPSLARLTRIGRVFAKLEGERPLGNFKSLGGLVAGTRALARWRSRSAGRSRLPSARLLCASDGNHGLAVAAAARNAGASASVYLSTSVTGARARRIEAVGGEIVWIQGTYDDAVRAAAEAAARGDGILVSDTSNDPDDAGVHDVMDGYAIIASELRVQLAKEMNARPTHLFVQAGVGGLAAAMAEGLRAEMSGPRKVLVVEPEKAACVARALAEGRIAPVAGDLRTSAEMLSCGLASVHALRILMRFDVQSILVSEPELLDAVNVLREAGAPETTASGAAGFAGLLHLAENPALRAACQLDSESCALFVITEGALSEPC
jgi:diaminopropionate ammonia-lyase